MLNQDFCEYLEFEISGAMRNSDDIEKRRCWCDGVLLPIDDDLSFDVIKQTKKIVTHAWIDEGQKGQFSYEMVIHFGDKAISQYSQPDGLKNCVPDIKNDRWISLDKEKRIIQVHLM
jgi:hypothetical protein